MLKVLFILRIDSDIKSGGDLIQANEYATVLKEHFQDDIEISFFSKKNFNEIKKVKWDLVQLFNISRIDEHIFILKKINYCKLSLAPIIQPKFLLSKKESIKSFIRGLLRGFLITYNSAAKKIFFLESCSLFIFLSTDEAHYFENTIFDTKDKKKIIINNGVNENIDFSKINGVRDIDFLIVGRIEDGKNSINIINILNRYYNKSNCTIVGSFNKYHYFYNKKFNKLISNMPNINYVGSYPHYKVLKLMKRSKFLLNISKKEVSPLVDLEALSCGTSVCSTTESFTHLVEDSSFIRVDPFNELEIVDKLKDFTLSNTIKRNSLNKVYTWKMCMNEYILHIEKLVDKKKLIS